MKTVLLLAVALTAVVAPTEGQNCHPHPDDLVLVVTPAVATPGEIVEVSVTNNSAACTYSYETICLLQSVHSGDCDGDKFLFAGCGHGPTAIAPGETATGQWDQTVGGGAHAPDGGYAFPIVLLADTGLIVELCAHVQIGTACTDPVSYGTGTAGSGGFVPSISTIGGPAALGSDTFGAAVTGGLGGAPSLVLVSLAEIDLPPFLVDPTAIAVSALLVLSDGDPGQGIGLLDLPVPPNPALLGLEIFLQGIVADGGAAGGLAFTDAVRTAICE